MTKVHGFFILVSALAATIACSETKERSRDGDTDAVGDTDVAGGDAGPARRCAGTHSTIRVDGAQAFLPLVEHPTRCLLYGADVTTGSIHFIDTDNDSVHTVTALGSAPTDITLSADLLYLYVALPGQVSIAVVDAFDGTVTDSVTTSVPPYRVARAPGHRVFYVEEEVFTSIHLVNLNTGVDEELTPTTLHEPDLAASADGSVLFVGEANRPGTRLIRYNTVGGLTEVDVYHFDGGFTLPSPERDVHLSETAGRVFYAGRAYNASALSRMLGWLGDQVVASTPDGSILATAEVLFDGDTFVRFANRPNPNEGAVFSDDGAWLYELSTQGSLLHRTAVNTLVGVHQLGETNVPPGSLAQHHFNQLVADPIRSFIYALDSQQNQLVFIDRDLLLPVRAEIIGSSPTDMALSPDASVMAVATFGSTSIAVIDLSDPDKVLKSTLQIAGNPFRLALGATGLLAYVEQDQFAEVTLIEFATGRVYDNLVDTVFQADVEMDPSGLALYVGESAGEEARLYKLDLSANTLAQVAVTTDSYWYPTRRVIYDDGSVYYAGHRFAAETLEDVGEFSEDIFAVCGTMAISRRRIFSTNAYEPDSVRFLKIGGLPVDSALVVCDPGGELVYQFDNDTGALFVQQLPSG